jgi:hypothetical protein
MIFECRDCLGIFTADDDGNASTPERCPECLARVNLRKLEAQGSKRDMLVRLNATYLKHEQEVMDHHNRQHANRVQEWRKALQARYGK